MIPEQETQKEGLSVGYTETLYLSADPLRVPSDLIYYLQKNWGNSL